jgi:hypothetical protein
MKCFDALGIIYLQYWFQEEVEVSFPNHPGISNLQYVCFNTLDRELGGYDANMIIEGVLLVSVYSKIFLIYYICKLKKGLKFYFNLTTCCIIL